MIGVHHLGNNTGKIMFISELDSLQFISELDSLYTCIYVYVQVLTLIRVKVGKVQKEGMSEK